MKVGVFDSGLGGLSILGAIKDYIPGIELAYCCDNFNFPYGTKSEADVITAALDATQRFFEQSAIDVLVIACNTASVVALEAIRQILPIPVVGVVPAIKPAALASKSKIIGVLATPVTIRRPYLESLIKEFASDCEVVKCGSSSLVLLAESKMRGQQNVGLTDQSLRTEMAMIIDAAKRGLDQLVLGCTHFPLIVDELRQVLPSTVNFVDSGQAVASRVRTILTARGDWDSTINMSSPGDLTGYCSGESFAIKLPPVFLASLENLVLRKLA
jgi:glutamate racemase